MKKPASTRIKFFQNALQEIREAVLELDGSQEPVKKIKTVVGRVLIKEACKCHYCNVLRGFGAPYMFGCYSKAVSEEKQMIKEKV